MALIFRVSRQLRRRPEPERLELLGKVVGYQPVTNVTPQLYDGRVKEGFDGRIPTSH